MLPRVNTGAKHVGEVRGDFLDQVDSGKVRRIGLAVWWQGREAWGEGKMSLER